MTTARHFLTLACPRVRLLIRRFQIRGEVEGVLVVDDYGHHPTEVAAVIAAARAGIGRRVVAVFQPHRFSRTEQLLDAFGPAFQGADEIVLTDIYAAGEAPIPGITVERLAESIREGSGSPVELSKTWPRFQRPWRNAWLGLSSILTAISQ